MATKSFIKTIGGKGLLADYNTEGKKLQTELTFDTTPTAASTNPVTSDGIKTAIDAKAYRDKSVAIFDGYMRRMNENTGWRRLAYKQFNETNKNVNTLFRLYLFGSNNDHIGLADLIVNIRFNNSGSAPYFDTCYLLNHKPIHTSVKVRVIGVAGNALVELWFRPLKYSLLTLTCLGNGHDVTPNTKDWTFGSYLSATDTEPVEDIANNIYVFSGTDKIFQLDIDNPTSGNLVAMNEKGLVKDSGISITSSDIDNWNSKQNSLTAGDNITIDSNTISSNQVFVATYGTTKYAEVKAAYDAGKICTVFKNPRYYYLTLFDEGNAVFTAPAPNPNIFTVTLQANNSWTSYNPWLQTHLTFDSTPRAGSNNPVTSDGIKTALDSRIPAPTSTTGTQVLKCIDGVIQWVTE